jgi:hypothetical protein
MQYLYIPQDKSAINNIRIQQVKEIREDRYLRVKDYP